MGPLAADESSMAANESSLEESGLPRRVLVSHAAPEAFAPATRPILAKLGYAIVTPEEFESMPEERPTVYIVDERSLAEVPEEDGRQTIPIVLLTVKSTVRELVVRPVRVRRMTPWSSPNSMATLSSRKNSISGSLSTLTMGTGVIAMPS